MSKPETTLHPWYGPCDAIMPDGGCAECDKVRRNEWSAWRYQWRGEDPSPSYWYAPDGTKVYRSYEDYCDG